MPKSIYSFGFKFGGPNPSDHVEVIDVRRYLSRNPYRIKGLRYLRGTDPAVAHDIESAPGFMQSYQTLLSRVASSKAEVVCLGCTAGHHRSVYMADRIARELGIKAFHRDIRRD
jgi:UPF0042 nucleotide-binding protein